MTMENFLLTPSLWKYGINHDLPNADKLKQYTCQNKLGRAEFLESNAKRCDRLMSDWIEYNVLSDVYERWKMSDSISAEDVVKYTRGYFDGPMSIITHGPKFEGDVEQIWKDNFK